jgi:hypothetical protein
MPLADVHIFGSVIGYRTIGASTGLHGDESSELETFQFGDISTSEAIARLEHHPSMTARPLASGRMAISRLLPAGLDDVGRPTIEVVTLVIDAHTYSENTATLELLAEDSSVWKAVRHGAADGYEYPCRGPLPSRPSDPALLRILDAWLKASRSGSVAILAEAAMPDLLCFVATLAPEDRVRCRWGLGIGAISSPVDVCTMLPGGSTRGARPVVRAAPAGAWHSTEAEYAQAYANEGDSSWRSAMWLSEQVQARLDSASNAGGGGGPDGTHAGRGDVESSASDLPAGWLGRSRKRLVASIVAAGLSTLLLGSATATYLLVGPTAKDLGTSVQDAESTAGALEIPPGKASSSGDLRPQNTTAPSDPATLVASEPRRAVGSEGPDVAEHPPQGLSAEAPAGGGSDAVRTNNADTGASSGEDGRPPPAAPGNPGSLVKQPGTASTPARTVPTPSTPDQPDSSKESPGVFGDSPVPFAEPTKETLGAPKKSMRATQLDGLLRRLREIPSFQRPNPAALNRGEEARRVDATNDQSLDEFFTIVWEVIRLDQDWREQRASAERGDMVGGFTQEPESTRGSDSEVLAVWRDITKVAHDWIADFEAGWGKKILESRMSARKQSWEQEKKEEALGNRDEFEKRNKRFQNFLTVKDWGRELKSAEQRSKGAPRREAR